MIKDLFDYLLSSRNWWLLPALLLILIASVAVFFTQTAVVISPFVYTIF